MARPNSAKTIATTRKLIAALQESAEVSMTELVAILNYSPPGVRKYISRLRASGIVDTRLTVRPGGGMHSFVRLVASGDKLALFLQRLDDGIAVLDLSMSPCDQRKLPNFQVGTMVHEMMDDLGMRIRKNAAVKPQRHWMDVALFGPARTPGAGS